MKFWITTVTLILIAIYTTRGYASYLSDPESTEVTGSKLNKANLNDLWYIAIDPAYMEVRTGHTKSVQVDFIYYNQQIDFDRRIEWTSLDPSIAEVDAEGNVTGKKSGTTFVKATASNGSKATCRVRVFNNVNNRLEVTIAGTDSPISEEIMVAGSRLQLASSFNDSDVSPLTEWSSSNPSVADIDEDGTVTCFGEGTATISANLIHDGKEYGAEVRLSCFLTMTPALYPVEIYEKAFLAGWSDVRDAENYIFEIQYLDTELNEFMPRKPVRFILEETHMAFDAEHDEVFRYRVSVSCYGREFEPTDWVVVDMANSGTHEILNDTAMIDYALPYEVYGLDGRPAGRSLDNLTRGIYIVRQNGNAVKVMIKI